MRAFALEADDPTVYELDLPTPIPQGREVVIDVTHVGVCHTDIHLRAGGYDLGRRGSLSMKDRGVEYPMVMGHEVVGVIAAVGEQVTDAQIGDTRLIYPWIGCGQCHQCRAGRENRCATALSIGIVRHGGYADSVLVPDEKYLVEIDGLDPSRVATFACSGLSAYSAVDKVLPLDPDDPVVVFGAGGLGLTAIGILRSKGHRAICAVDLADENLALATEQGASHAVKSSDNVAEAITAELGGEAAATIDFVNNGATASTGFDILAKGGAMIQVGLYGGEVTLPTVLLAMRMIRVEGSYVGTLDQLKDLVRTAQTSGLPESPAETRPLSATEVTRALDELTAGRVGGRIVLTA